MILVAKQNTILKGLVESMKKEIMNLINSKDGIFRLNNISYLNRWTKDALENDVDRLSIEFDSINGVSFSLYDRTIVSRDYEGIIAECQKITTNFLNEVNNTLVKDFKAGYKNAR